jgi:hypothetical protein
VSLDVLCRLAAIRWHEAAAAVSVPMRVAGAPRAQTLAAVDLAREGEELQVTVGEGPSLDVLAGAGAIEVRELTGESAARWPLFAPDAFLLGIRSMAVLPMRVGAARFGAFAVYLRRPGGLHPTDVAEAITLSSIALDLLFEDLAPPPPGTPADGTGGAGFPGGGDKAARLVDDRPEIHQATGMLAIQLGVDLPTALLRLRARAFAENRRLSHLAADVVSRVVRFDREQPPAPESGGAYDG